MNERLVQYDRDIKEKKVAFVGFGVSHKDLVPIYVSKGAKVFVCDKRSENELGVEICSELRSRGVTFELGESYLEHLSEMDVVFRTPGMNYFTPELRKAKENGVIITSEMETFFELCPAPIFAVTGSDGKTTTTSVIAEFLKKAGKKVYLGGNIGTPLLPLIEEVKASDIAVVELSSFQLISMRPSPTVSVITNIAPNHLDVHKDMDEYIEAKTNILKYQSGYGRTVLNADNEITNSLSEYAKGELCKFSIKHPVDYGTYMDKNGDILITRNDLSVRVMNKQDIKIPGMHNVENYLAAIAAVIDFVDIPDIVKVAKTFEGVEHRIEFVREIDGVRWYNDSIASSPTRFIAGLGAFSQKLIVIAGGYDKKIPFEPMGAPAIEKVKTLILMSDTAEKIENVMRATEGFKESGMKIVRVSNMDEAVAIAHEIAQDGDIVTLSPACASFGLYQNFEFRGRHYKELVMGL